MPEWTVEWKSDLNIYDPMQILQKKSLSAEISYLS